VKVFLAVCVSALGIACADSPAAPRLAETEAEFRWQAGDRCNVTVIGLILQARTVFGWNNPHNLNTVRNRLDLLEQLRRRGRVADAQQRAHQIVDFILELHRAGRLSGTDAQVASFINAIYCLAGIRITLDNPDDTYFILPSDQPQVIAGLDSSVTVSLPANPVGEPSLLRVERLDGRLNTKLDQYPGFIRITLLNSGNTSLAGRATITVCASGLPADLNLANLRLGHGIRDTGFVITPLPTSSDPAPANVACGPTPPGSLASRLVGAVRGLFSPRELQATMQGAENAFGGGVSGTVTEFSPFAPVDVELSFGGGVSGTVTEFVRDGAPALMSAVESMTPACGTLVEGSPLVAACQPVVSVTTRQGTVLEQVPIDWFARSIPGATIAPRTGDLNAINCGIFGVTASTVTSINGNAGVCWNLGGIGSNRVVARARVGGDAPVGVRFSNDGADSVVFDVNIVESTTLAGKSTQILIISGDGQSAAAGSNTAEPLVVRVLDTFNNPVAYTTVRWQVIDGSGTLSPATVGPLSFSSLIAQSSVSAAPSAVMTAVTDANGFARMRFAPGVDANQVKAYIDSYAFKFVYLYFTGTTP
jgi:hypothetical protein